MKRYYTDGGIPSLRVALFEHMNADELKVLATLTKTRAPTRKGELVDHILEYLRGDRLRTVWQCLDDVQKAAVAEVVHSDGTVFLADQFHAKYGRLPDWGTVSPYSRDKHPTALRFFFYASERGSMMPDDLKERLKAFVPPPVEAKVKTVSQFPPCYDRPHTRWNEKQGMREEGIEETPLAVRETEQRAQRELLSVLRLVDAGKIAVSDKTRRPSASTIDVITAVLEGGDYYPHLPPKNKWYDENAGPIRAFAWPLLIQAGGLAQLSGTRLQLTRAGRKALSEPTSGTIRTLWTKWLATTIIDELSRIECVKGQTGKAKRGLTAVSSRRDAVAYTLAACPVGAWIASEEFIRFMRASGNDFAVTRDAWGLYIGEPQYGSLGSENHARILDERYLLCLLFEYAATLGMIDVALIPPAGARHDYHDMWGTDELLFFSRYDGLMYLRITPLGVFCLDMASEYQPAPVEVKPVLRVLPNLEIAAIGAALEQSDRLALDAYANRVSDLVWRLDAGKLLAVAEEGRPVAEIREFLAARSGDPLPDTVLRLIEDVADRSAKVIDRGLARFVECADPALAALIANDSRTRKHCMRAGERHLVVSASSEAAFRRALREVGYLLSMGEARPARNHRTGPSNDAGLQVTDA